MDWSKYQAALFDLDGVLTPTSELHMRAWSDLFNGYLASIGMPADYSDQDYFAYVDGKPRYAGVSAFLASRGIGLPQGDPSDEPEKETICGLGNRKNEVFNQLLQDQGIQAYRGSRQLVEALQARDIKLAVVSSSRNANEVLASAELADFFPIVVDGVYAADNSLSGKPAPDTFRRAAELLSVSPEQAVVFEDALSGVAAGKAGGFGMVVGVDRGAGEQELKAAGADLVVTDLAELLP